MEKTVYTQYRILFLSAVFFLITSPLSLNAEPVSKISPDDRCVVCGMFVAKYDNWIVQALLEDKQVLFFDGVKDMLVFYYNPGEYSRTNRDQIREIWVKDYYTLQWLEARRAKYVIGSDVYGPMGKEFIPFSTQAAAESFLRDHHGEKILGFEEITGELVQSMRSGSQMRHGSK